MNRIEARGEMIKVEQAADMLGISRRMMYDLAAPHGPVPCIRLSVKCVRFNPDDVEAYAKKCLHTTIKVEAAGYLSSAKLSTGQGSELQKLYRMAGTVAKQKPLTKRKPTGSTALQLVQSKHGL